ncbi:hypothetical protein [Luteimonas lutimaris]
MTMRACVLLLLLSVMAPAQAQVDADAGDGYCSPRPVEQVRNSDGSVLALATECPTPDLRRHVVTLDCANGRRCDRMELEQPGEYALTGGARIIDLGDDGMHEIEVTGSCGAGPNCEGDVYAVDPDAGKLVHLFSGGYSELFTRDGWLVESGRASCCAWEYHLWNLGGNHTLPLGEYDTMDLMVKVGAIMDEEGFDCVFLRGSGDNWQAVAPPSPALETLCEVYDKDYRLKPPDPTPGAEARRQEQ